MMTVSFIGGKKLKCFLYIQLTDSDLRNNPYSLEDLRENVENLSISTLLKWQHLDVSFCKEFILNEDYQCVEEQYMVDIQYVLKMQPHLNYEDFS